MSRVGEMNAVAVFVSLLFWGWIWGVWGLLLAVPITAANQGDLRPHSGFLGRRGTLEGIVMKTACAAAALLETVGPTAANLRAVIEIERQNQHDRTKVQVLTDRVTSIASSFPFVAFHLCWFSIWIGVNTLSSHHFDPFPFNLLTMIVSLEAILLTAFVLMSQSHMTLLADRRAHLDLQVNLLAERELTAILKAVSLLSDKVGVDIHQCDARISMNCSAGPMSKSCRL